MPALKRKIAVGKKTPKSTAFGRELIAGLTAVNDALKLGGMAAVEKQFTVRRVRRNCFETPPLLAADVTQIRGMIAVSQAVFAAMLGVSANTVRAWEQGVNPPSGMAVRFLDEIRRNPEYWKLRVSSAAEPASA